MSATLYDEAVLNKIKKWIKDPKVKITGPNETRRSFEYIADITNDHPIELPLITLRRGSTITIQHSTKRPLSYDANRQIGEYTDEGTFRHDNLPAIPITIEYQLDIYTRYFEEAEEYVRDFVFKLINNPTVKIEIPYNSCNKIHASNIRLHPEIQDNSDIPERMIADEFTRKTLSFYIDDAYLFSYNTKDASTIEVETEIVEDNKLN